MKTHINVELSPLAIYTYHTPGGQHPSPGALHRGQILLRVYIVYIDIENDFQLQITDKTNLPAMRMQFFLLLLVLVAVAPPVDMKTVEERLSYLEEMAKLNVIRSCDELSQFGVRANNFYRIDPDGPLTGSDPIKVWCEFSQDGRSITEVLHNSEQAIEVEKCPEPGCYHHPVTYSAPDDQIEALKQISEACEQEVHYESKMDAGTITDMSTLPINILDFGGLTYTMQKASHTLGRLRCWGKAAYEEATSCVAMFEKVEQDLVKVNENISKTNEDLSQVEQDLVKVNEDISKTNADISQVEQDLVKVNEDIGNIQHEVAMHSSYCGYQSGWTSDSTTITYDKLTLEDNNIPGASMDASSGRYTAATAGTYEVDLSIGYMFSNNALYNNMCIRLNEVNIEESRIISQLHASDSSAKEAGGRSLMIRMNRGDTVSVYGYNINEMRHITFCVKLITAST